MSPLQFYWNRIRTSFGYDAVDDSKKRRQANLTARSEDVELNAAKRKQLIAQANDSMRNFAIARGRHTFDRVIRMTEASAVVRGDHLSRSNPTASGTVPASWTKTWSTE